MSFLFGSTVEVPLPEQSLSGLQPERMSTNQSARILPWFLGTRWVGTTWLGNVWNIRTDEIRRGSGKRETIVGTWYYANFAGLLCAGPVDRIYEIKFDTETIWEGDIERAEGENYVNITARFGVFRLYWGTEEQTLDDDLDDSGEEHSAYRGQCYIIGLGILLGADRTTVPNLQVKLSRKPRAQTIVSAGDEIIGSEETGGYDINPVSMLVDLWTDPRFGLGRNESLLDTSRLRSVAAQLKTESVGISPFLTSSFDMKDALLKLFEHIDGYPTSFDGNLGMDLIRPESAVATLSDDDLTKDPSIRSQSWHETYSEISVRFSDAEINNQDNSAVSRDLARVQIVGTPKAQNLHRPWVTQFSIAQKIASARGRVAGQPQFSGTCSVLQSSAESITVGSVFNLTTRDGATLSCRCTERTEPAPDRRVVDLTFSADTGWANDEFYTAETPTIADLPTLEPAAPYATRILDCPYALKSEDELTALIYLVARGDTHTSSFTVWRSTSEDGTYENTASRPGADYFWFFAVRAQLSADYSATTDIIDQTVGISFEVLSPDETPLEDEWALEDALKHTLLCFCGSAGNEILSLFDVTRTGDGTYTAKCVRALYDTLRRDHSAGTELWIQLRERLAVDVWPPISEAERFYKVQTRFRAAELDLSTVDAISHTENRRALRPIAPLNVKWNGSESGEWSAGQDSALTWTNTSRARTRYGLQFSSAPPTDLDYVVLEFWTDSLLATVEVSPTESYTVTASFLDANGITDFDLRVWGKREGLLSIDYTSIQVRRV